MKLIIFIFQKKNEKEINLLYDYNLEVNEELEEFKKIIFWKKNIRWRIIKKIYWKI